mgnify:CR=1 FL=1
MKTRIEHDLLGEKEVPADAYYGIQTLRGIENFQNISGITIGDYPNYVKALAMVKWAAAKANQELEILPDDIANAITRACEEIIGGKLHDQFPVDLIQGGAGTSTNMNINEVVANRALELMGHQKGEYQYCHPNNHVNMSQSTNDAYPTSFKLAFIFMNEELVADLKLLIQAFRAKGEEFKEVLKMGRTQLQDAVPMTMGQEFEAFAANLEEEVDRLNQMAKLFLEVNMGATAIGTGINSEPEYSSKCIKNLRIISGEEFVDECQIESDLELLLPATYVTGSSERMLLYRELDGLTLDKDVDAFRFRLEDRFGPVPPETQELLRIVPLRRLAARLGVEKVFLKGGRMTLFFVSNADSPFYQSQAFGKMIDYMMKYTRRCDLREQNGRRSMLIKDVTNVETAVSVLQEIVALPVKELDDH